MFTALYVGKSTRKPVNKHWLLFGLISVPYLIGSLVLALGLKSISPGVLAYMAQSVGGYDMVPVLTGSVLRMFSASVAAPLVLLLLPLLFHAWGSLTTREPATCGLRTTLFVNLIFLVLALLFFTVCLPVLRLALPL